MNRLIRILLGLYRGPRETKPGGFFSQTLFIPGLVLALALPICAQIPSAAVAGGGSGSGNVVGPASATDGHLAVFDSTTGKVIKDGGALGDLGGGDMEAATYVTSGAGAPSNPCATIGIGYINTTPTPRTFYSCPSAGGNWVGPFALASAIGTAGAATLGTGAGQVPVTGDYQPSDADLTAIAALSCNENEIIKRNGAGAWVCAADATGGSPSFDGIASGTNKSAAMVVDSGASIAHAGSGTIAATTSDTAAALAANGGNCESGNAPLGVDASGAVEGCWAVQAALTGPMTQAVANSAANTLSVSVGTSGTAFAKTPATVDPTTGAALFPGGVSSGDGTVAGESKLLELTANGNNYRSWLAPDVLTADLQLKHANGLPAGSLMAFPTPTGSVSQYSWLAYATAATASTIAERNASGELIAANTVATGKTPMATDTVLVIGQFPALDGDVTTSAGDFTTAIAANAVTPAKASAVMRTRSMTVVLTGSGAAGVLLDTDDQPAIWYNSLGQGVTLTGVSCKTDSATATRIQLNRDDGSPAAILTDNTAAGVDCSSTRAAGALDGTEEHIASTNGIDLVVVSAGGAGKWVSVTITYTLD